MRKLWMIAALCGVLTLGVVAGAAATGWLEVTAPPDLKLPRDHGAHPDTRTEWWYITGLVNAEDGRRFGFQVTFFRQGLIPGNPEPGESRLRARQVVAAHLAVADVEAARFHHAERLRRSAGGLAGWSEKDLDVWLEDWSLTRQANGSMVIVAEDRKRGISLDLHLQPQRSLVLHGDAGYSQKGPEPGNASAYVSWTRLAVGGPLSVAGFTGDVEGTAWFDHEWGSSQLGEEVVGWDWFSLRLEDGRDLMVYRLRRADGSADPYSSGTVVSADGTTARLGRDDVVIEPLRWWQSPVTKGRYPVRWRMVVAAHGIDLEIAALLDDAELDGRATTGVIYWEGPIEASGSVSGEGYAELTGYAGSLQGLF